MEWLFALKSLICGGSWCSAHGVATHFALAPFGSTSGVQNPGACAGKRLGAACTVAAEAHLTLESIRATTYRQKIITSSFGSPDIKQEQAIIMLSH
eukprot:5476943-Amphidinium_carterae.1